MWKHRTITAITKACAVVIVMLAAWVLAKSASGSELKPPRLEDLKQWATATANAAASATTRRSPQQLGPQLASEPIRQAPIENSNSADIPVCARQLRAESFVLLFVTHSGSTALLTALEKNRRIRFAGTAANNHEPIDHAPQKSDHDGALRQAERFFKDMRKRGIVGGLKMKPYHILARPTEWGALFDRYSTRIIWMFRGNLFKQAVGEYDIIVRGERIRFGGYKIDKTAHKKKRFSVDNMQALHKILLWRRGCNNDLERAVIASGEDRCILPMSYEAFSASPAVQIERAQKFLGLEVMPGLTPGRRKVGKDSLCAMVSNWNDVCAAFYGCDEWRAMMEDTVNECSCPHVSGKSRLEWHKFCFEPDPEVEQYNCYNGCGFKKFLQKYSTVAHPCGMGKKKSVKTVRVNLLGRK